MYNLLFEFDSLLHFEPDYFIGVKSLTPPNLLPNNFKTWMKAIWNCYLNQILEDLTSSDVRVLVKGAEEASQTKHFARIFPRKGSYKYFQYFDSLSYYDKLLDAFEEKFSENPEAGIDMINSYCQRNVHQWYTFPDF